jgi:recombination protein RecT
MAKTLTENLAERASGEKKQVVPKDYLQSDEFIGKLARSCGDNLKFSKKIVASYLTSYMSNPTLQATSLRSQMISLIQCATVGLIPNTPLGQAHVVPYGADARYQLGYAGIVELCRRAGVHVFAEVVREGDEFDVTAEDGKKKYRHKLNLIKLGKVTGVYAGWKTDTDYDFVYWPLEQIIKHAKKYSKSFENPAGAWRNVSDKESCEYNIAMLKKTVLIDALRYAPKSIELATAIDADTKLDAGLKTSLDFSDVIDVTPQAGADNA